MWAALGAFTALAVAAELAGTGGLLAIVFGLPLVLLIPGYTLTAVFWPSASLGVPEGAATAVGISLALAAASGLLLNWLPGGMDGRRSTVLLGLVALCAIATLLLRDRRGPAGVDQERATIKTILSVVSVRPHQVLLAAAALGLVVTAVLFAAQSAAHSSGPGFTQAWMVPERAPGGRLAIGLQNEERRGYTYRLRLRTDRGQVREWDGVRLAPGQRWSTTTTAPAGAAGGEAELLVYRSDAPYQVYRQLRVSLILPPPGGGGPPGPEGRNGGAPGRSGG
jgi:uncharacterized membrane protein